MGRIKAVLHKLVYVEGQPLHPLVHVLLLQTLIWGISFTFFGLTDTVQASILWNLSQATLFSTHISWWGLSMIGLSVANTLCVYYRSLKWSRRVAISGFGLWCYAILLYALGGFWFQLCVAGLTNLLFWGWWYIAVSRFVHERTKQ